MESILKYDKVILIKELDDKIRKVGEVYEIAKPESIRDIKTYIESAKAAVTADTEGKAKISMYNFALATSLLKGAVYSAFDMLNGTITAENFAKKVNDWAIAAADNKNFTVTAYEGLENTFMCYCPEFETIR